MAAWGTWAFVLVPLLGGALASCSVLFEAKGQSDAGPTIDAADFEDSQVRIAQWQYSTSRAIGYVGVDPLDSVTFAGSLPSAISLGAIPVAPEGPSDVLFVQLDSAGTFFLSRQFGASGSEFVTDFKISSQGRYLISGPVAGTVDLTGEPHIDLDSQGGTQPYESYVASYANDFADRWSIVYESTSNDVVVNGIDVAANATYVCGAATLDITLAAVGDGQLVTGFGEVAGFYAHYDASGAFVGNNYAILGPESLEENTEVRCAETVADGLGGQYIVGTFNPTMSIGGSVYSNTDDSEESIVIARLEHGNVVDWATQLAGNTKTRPKLQGAALPDGDIVLAVQFDGEITSSEAGRSLVSGGGGDIALYRLDAATGRILYSKSFPSVGGDLATEVAVGPNGEIALVGHFTGSISFGGDELHSESASDAFVAVFSEQGEHLWSQSYGSAGDDSALGVDFDSSGALYVTFRHQGLNVGLEPLDVPVDEAHGLIVKFVRE